MPFGKHRGKPLDEIPFSYLEWVLESCNTATPRLKEEIRRVIGNPNDTTKPQGAVAISSLASNWYRQLAREFHPDRGGSHEAMKAINRANELLLALAGVAG